MKKLQRFIALALTVAILGVTLCSCSNVGKSIMDDTYSQYENGKRDVPIEVLIKLCRYYQVSADYILGLAEKK